MNKELANALAGLEVNNIPADIITLNKEALINKLSAEDCAYFNELVDGMKLDEEEQIELLREKVYAISKPTYQNKGKLAIIKKVAEWLAKLIGEKSIASIMDFLFGWEDDLEKGAVEFLVQKCGWNRDVAYWTCHAVVWIFG